MCAVQPLGKTASKTGLRRLRPPVRDPKAGITILRVGGRFADSLTIGGLTLRHEPAPGATHEIAGHLHPPVLECRDQGVVGRIHPARAAGIVERIAERHHPGRVVDLSGALWLPAHRTLVVSDLHLEKGSSYAARSGQFLPSGPGRRHRGTNRRAPPPGPGRGGR
jgi:metallophosphoesterase superfamily enzyme